MTKSSIIRITITLLFCLNLLLSFSQKVYTKGDVVQNMELKNILNHSSSSSSFNNLRNELTIVDFFGTWCVPCLKALPHLSKIKQQFKDQVNIVLVSNESETQLSGFIKKRSNFLFPVIVDETGAFTNLFSPPSLPYTVIVNKDGQILEITEAEEITGEKIKAWLASKTIVTKDDPLTKVLSPASMFGNKKSSNKTVKLSQEFIYSAKTSSPADAFLIQLRTLNYNDLLALDTDDLKNAFWINLYNGYTQVLLQGDPGKYKNRNSFFKSKQIDVAGMLLSLDDIEHNFLRRSKIKWSLGHLNKLFPSKREKEMRVDKVDYRIHFALNCGAKSCPPIAFYNNETLDAQLELATKAYLYSETDYDSSKNVVMLPAIMSWFRADFGGKKGMIQILKKHNIIPADAKPKIRFKDYDWTLMLNNYTNQNI